MTPIITIKEARKVLGKGYSNLSDDMIKQIINQVDFFGDVIVPHLRKEAVPKYPVVTSNINDKGE